MNTTTAAAQANVTVATIRKWARTGVITAAKTGRRWVIDAASLAYRINLPALLKPTKDPRMDLTATYTHTYAGHSEPTTITPQIKTRVRGDVTITSITGLAPLLTDHLATMAEPQRLHALEVLRTARIVITDTADEDEATGSTQTTSWADHGRLTTTYDATAGLPVAVVLNLAARLRASITATAAL
jgi:excisionase family DNA binding protein